MEAAIVLGVLVLSALFFAGVFNRLVRMRNQTQNAWNQIDVQLKRRHDLVPNLVETVKGYAAHEKGTLENITRARSQAMGARGRADQIQAEGALSGALMNLLAVAENYPDLKANQNFLALQEELTSTENKISFSRQHYNDSVMEYDNGRQQFPGNIVSGMFNFRAEPYWKIYDATQREVPAVSFS